MTLPLERVCAHCREVKTIDQFFGVGARLLKSCSVCRSKVVEADKPLNPQRVRTKDKPRQINRAAHPEKPKPKQLVADKEKPTASKRDSTKEKPNTSHRIYTLSTSLVEKPRTAQCTERYEKPDARKVASPTEESCDTKPYRVTDCSYFKDQDEYLGSAKKVAYDFIYGRL